MDEILRGSNKTRKQPYRVEHTPAVLAEPKSREKFSDRLRMLGDVLEERAESFRQKNARALHKFDRALTSRRANPLAFLALATVLGITAVVGVVYTPTYVVSVDGVALGVVKNPQVFEGVERRVEARATSILGYNYQLDHMVTYDFALSERDQIPAAAQFETYLFNQIGAVMKSYVLTVDGKVIGAATDEAEISGLLEDLKARYTDENTVSVDFTSAVHVSHQYISSEVEQDAAAIRDMLTANTNGQTTYEVQPGDTFMQLAWDNGMEMEEMEALNPSVDVDKLQIGQLLNIKEEIPFLGVRTVNSISYQEPIACPVEEVKDDSMYQGDSTILQQGVQGQSLISANVTYLNGKEQARDITGSEVVSEPTTKIVAVGTKERPKTMAKGYFIWPVYGHVTSGYGSRYIFGSTSYHSGIDIATSYGTGIAAADGGTVIFSGTGAGSNWSYGKLVIIDHGNGKQTYYGHCSSLLVSAGDKVYQGQTIARVGSTGRSTGNHCHFQVKESGTTVSPYNYLP